LFSSRGHSAALGWLQPQPVHRLEKHGWTAAVRRPQLRPDILTVLSPVDRQACSVLKVLGKVFDDLLDTHLP